MAKKEGGAVCVVRCMEKVKEERRGGWQVRVEMVRAGPMDSGGQREGRRLEGVKRQDNKNRMIKTSARQNTTQYNMA